MLQISNIGVLTAFGAGLISFLSPCVLPLVPGYVSYIAGRTIAHAPQDAAARLPVLTRGVCFVLGFSTVFVLLGASATAIGRLLLSYRYELNLAGGAFVVVFGLLLTGLVQIGSLQREFRWHGALPGRGSFAAYLLGLAFGFGWTPCIGPVLGAILTISAASSGVFDGAALLAIYSMGLGVPFLLAAGSADALAARMQPLRRTGRVLQVAAGIVIIAMGMAMMTDTLPVLAYWLLDAFPVLARMG